MKKINIISGILIIVIIVSLSSCAPEGYTPREYGFFSGMWHGIIILVSLIGKLFGADIGIYAQHNSGFFYWLGFIFGILLISGGGGASARRRRRR